MDTRSRANADENEKKVEELKAEQIERRIAPAVLNPDGDGLITGKLKPRDR